VIIQGVWLSKHMEHPEQWALIRIVLRFLKRI
jgi:hypothetical protein